MPPSRTMAVARSRRPWRLSGNLTWASSLTWSRTSSLRIILPVRESSTMPPLHHHVRGHCHDSTPLLLSAHGLGTPVAVCHVVSSMAKPQWGASTAVRHAQHVATHTRQGAETVCRPDAQTPLCGL